MEAKNVRSRITKYIKKFEKGIDYIDIKRACDVSTLIKLGYSKQMITQAKNIYLLSERGYMKTGRSKRPVFMSKNETCEP